MMRLVLVFFFILYSSSSLSIEDDDFQTEVIAAESEGPKISTTRYVVGGILGTYPGFGIGHTVQGRWRSSGWIYTLGESVSLLTVLSGTAACDSPNSNGCGDEDLRMIGGIAFLGFKIAELIDIWGVGYSYQQEKSNFSATEKLVDTLYILPEVSSDKVGIKFGFRF